MAVSDLSDPTFWIPTIVSFVAVVLFYIDMRWRFKKEQDASTSMVEMIRLMKEELELFRKQAQSGQLTSQEIERHKLLQRQSEFQWRKMKDTIQGLKWLAEVAKEFDE